MGKHARRQQQGTEDRAYKMGALLSAELPGLSLKTISYSKSATAADTIESSEERGK
jgi:hypothetical protein